MFIRVFLEEINIGIDGLSKADGHPQSGWASCNLLAWIQWKWVKLGSCSLLSALLGQRSSDMDWQPWDHQLSVSHSWELYHLPWLYSSQTAEWELSLSKMFSRSIWTTVSIIPCFISLHLQTIFYFMDLPCFTYESVGGGMGLHCWPIISNAGLKTLV